MVRAWEKSAAHDRMLISCLPTTRERCGVSSANHWRSLSLFIRYLGRVSSIYRRWLGKRCAGRSVAASTGNRSQESGTYCHHEGSILSPHSFIRNRHSPALLIQKNRRSPAKSSSKDRFPPRAPGKRPPDLGSALSVAIAFRRYTSRPFLFACCRQRWSSSFHRARP